MVFGICSSGIGHRRFTFSFVLQAIARRKLEWFAAQDNRKAADSAKLVERERSQDDMQAARKATLSEVEILPSAGLATAIAHHMGDVLDPNQAEWAR